MTQQDVINHIKKHGYITTMQSRAKFGSNNLTAVVDNINAKGDYKIIPKLVGRITFDWQKRNETQTHYVLDE